MTEMPCGYAGDRDDTLIAYLYDDIDPVARAAFDVHLATCLRCRAELDGMRGVRTQLGRWNPPEPKRVLTFDASIGKGPQAGRRASAWATLREIPAWAQVAAALLFLGVSAGIANLDVRYDSQGLVIHTGWASSPQPEAAVAPAANVAPGFSPASKTDLAALEQRLRGEFRAVPTATATAAVRPSNDAEVLRKVRALVDEAERRQQRELALRLAQAITDVNATRQADLRRIDHSLNGVQNTLGVEVLKNRQQVQYLLRVNQKQ